MMDSTMMHMLQKNEDEIRTLRADFNKFAFCKKLNAAEEEAVLDKKAAKLRAKIEKDLEKKLNDFVDVITEGKSLSIRKALKLKARMI